MRRKRIMKLGISILFLAIASATALLLFVKTGFGVPCVFHEITKLNCPGCGNTRAVLSLLRLDFVSAFKSNAMFVVEFAYIAYAFIDCSVRYIRNGFFRYHSSVNAIDITALVLISGWCVVRNIIGI